MFAENNNIEVTVQTNVSKILFQFLPHSVTNTVKEDGAGVGLSTRSLQFPDLPCVASMLH